MKAMLFLVATMGMLNSASAGRQATVEGARWYAHSTGASEVEAIAQAAKQCAEYTENAAGKHERLVALHITQVETYSSSIVAVEMACVVK